MQSEGTADWNEVLKAVQLRDSLGSEALIMGNGDVASYEDGLKKALAFHPDGIMVGRGIFSNPAFFAEPENLDLNGRIQLLKKHLTRFTDEWEGVKNYAILKRFFKIYLHSFENATSLRAKLMDTNNSEEGRRVIEKFELV